MIINLSWSFQQGCQTLDTPAITPFQCHRHGHCSIRALFPLEPTCPNIPNSQRWHKRGNLFAVLLTHKTLCYFLVESGLLSRCFLVRFRLLISTQSLQCLFPTHEHTLAFIFLMGNGWGTLHRLLHKPHSQSCVPHWLRSAFRRESRVRKMDGERWIQG